MGLQQPLRRDAGNDFVALLLLLLLVLLL
jgi:hypothetical protein